MTREELEINRKDAEEGSLSCKTLDGASLIILGVIWNELQYMNDRQDTPVNTLYKDSKAGFKPKVGGTD